MPGSHDILKPLACYGAALSTTMIASGVDAAVVSLTANPTTINTSSLANVDMTGAVSFSFDFLNTSNFGRSIYGGITGYPYFGVMNFSQTLTSSYALNNFTTTVYLASFGFDGNIFVGFRTFVGNLGYIEFDFDANGDVEIVSAFVNDEVGQSIHIGNIPIPLPASLPLMAGGMLALGAAGVRRRRKKRAEA